jgi:hypothetical protein
LCVLHAEGAGQGQVSFQGGRGVVHQEGVHARGWFM